MRVAAKMWWKRVSVALVVWCAMAGADRVAGQETAQNAPLPPVTLKDGDRVVFLGDGFFEREYEFGYIETAITSRFPDIKLTFRNLGWTGDTVWGDARAGFDTAKEGFARRAALVKELKPNLILVCYGMNESFAGEPGLPKFEEGLKALLDSLEETKAQIVLIAPMDQESKPEPLPDPASHNKELATYRIAMRRAAHSKGVRFVDMETRFAEMAPHGLHGPSPITEDGIHLDKAGYWQVARLLETSAFGVKSEDLMWRVGLKGEAPPRPNTRQFPGITGTSLSKIRISDTRLEFEATDCVLPLFVESRLPPRLLSVVGLAPGKYELRIDGKPVSTQPRVDWSFAPISRCPEIDQSEGLRRVIIEKNKLLFHRLRPQNETYLYLFRKHEQGHMAGEIPQFDPLIAEKEAEIDRLKKPVPHTYELIRVEEEKK